MGLRDLTRSEPTKRTCQHVSRGDRKMANAIKKAIQIFARLKPMPGSSDSLPYEIEPIDTDGTNDDILVVNLKQQNVDEGYYAHKPQENHRFRYSKVFDCASPQEEIFEHICRPVIDGALAGYNGTIFAYGQTGSGKTYTMTGSRANFQERGIIPRTLSYIFQRFQELEDGMELQAVYISYLEIYNENGYDLLHPNMASGKLEDLKKVVLLEDAQQQIHLKHLSVNPVDDEDEAMHLFYMGEHHRTIAETPMNEASTRSHCVFTIHVHTRETSGAHVRRSKIHLVDLAGSERIANSNISGQLFNEARHINLALHYLEQVIVALGEANRTHIPYRNSMMTSILRDSLGGNCMTTMIATLSLEGRNIPETLSTCRFSQRVALVTNDATLNEEVDPELLIVQLKAEIKRLKSMMSTASLKPIVGGQLDLNADEFEECCVAVQDFLMDPDDKSFLTITPDMRLVQQCFICLKSACKESRMKLSADTTGPLLSDQRFDELMKMLESRETEIKVLTKMLKESQNKNDQGESSHTPKIVPGPAKKTVKTAKTKSDATYVKLNEAMGKLNKPPYSPPATSRPKETQPIEKESLLLEGFSEQKREAWDNFMNSCGVKDQVNEARDGLLRYRAVISKIKEEMNKQHEHINHLKRAMMTATTNEEVDLSKKVYKEAHEKHQQIIAKKEKQLLLATGEAEKQETILKSLYTKMLESFESDESHKQASQLRHVAAGVFKGTVAENIKLYESKKKTSPGSGSGKNQDFVRRPWMHSHEDLLSITCPKKDRKADKNEGNKSTQHKDKLESSSEENTHLLDAKKTFPTVSGRGKGKPGKDDPPTTSPKKKANNSTKRRERHSSSSSNSSTESEIIPPNYISSSKSKAKSKSQLIKTRNRSPLSSSDEDFGLKTADQNNNNDDDVGECPMTGDPACDREIISFLKKRQAVFQRITESGQCTPTQGSVPASRSTSMESAYQSPNSKIEHSLQIQKLP